MSTDNLQQAISTAVAEVRRRRAGLTPADVEAAYTAYHHHFANREEDPPVSQNADEDELLLAIWDVIVDRETEGMDSPDEELEDYYAAAFTALLNDEPESTEPAGEPVAMAQTVEVATEPAEPTEVIPEGDSESVSTLESEQSEPQESIYLVRITLDGSRPTIWREVLIPSGTRQSLLHHIIQAAMGWRGTEDYQFFPSLHREQNRPGEPTLGDLLGKVGEQCGYEFDNWYHDLELRDIRQAQGRTHYPVCIAGARACPPQDIGGVAAYNEKIKILNDPSHYEYEELASWLTQDFNPGAFNMDQTNLRLGQYGDNTFHAVV
ncbi:plasmid pRiA4b ORF-3 family protein [Neolewinella litorea]|nr:plasmid pRiA4b ORF-3 family protein [Neolewinella litorea]